MLRPQMFLVESLEVKFSLQIILFQNNHFTEIIRQILTDIQTL